jgi:hypothetical protein
MCGTRSLDPLEALMITCTTGLRRPYQLSNAHSLLHLDDGRSGSIPRGAATADRACACSDAECGRKGRAEGAGG